MKFSDLEDYFQHHRKLLGVLVFILGIVAMSGFFMGMRETDSEVASYRQPVEMADVANTEYPPAPKYGEIQDSEILANKHWHFDFSSLKARAEMPDTAEPLDEDELASILKERSQRRAYDGAPPVIPHEIDQRRAESCMTCHGPESEVQIAGLIPSQISHPYFANCTQCHVPADGLRRLTADKHSRLWVENDFQGLVMAGQSTRAYVGAPPTVPHPLWMRQNCVSCHGPGRQNAIRTSHPTRGNCLQCHAPNGAMDNRERLPKIPFGPLDPPAP